MFKRKERYGTKWEETLWTAYDYETPSFESAKPKANKIALVAASLVATAAFAQVATQDSIKINTPTFTSVAKGSTNPSTKSVSNKNQKKATKSTIKKS